MTQGLIQVLVNSHSFGAYGLFTFLNASYYLENIIILVNCVFLPQNPDPISLICLIMRSLHRCFIAVDSNGGESKCPN